MHHNRYIVRDDNRIFSSFLYYDAKNYQKFLRCLKQLIQFPTRVTCSTSTLTDHVLTSVPSIVSRKVVINVGVSDHQLIFRTKKFLESKQLVSISI